MRKTAESIGQPLKNSDSSIEQELPQTQYQNNERPYRSRSFHRFRSKQHYDQYESRAYRNREFYNLRRNYPCNKNSSARQHGRFQSDWKNQQRLQPNQQAFSNQKGSLSINSSSNLNTPDRKRSSKHDNQNQHYNNNPNNHDYNYPHNYHHSKQNRNYNHSSSARYHYQNRHFYSQQKEQRYAARLAVSPSQQNPKEESFKLAIESSSMSPSKIEIVYKTPYSQKKRTYLQYSPDLKKDSQEYDFHLKSIRTTAPRQQRFQERLEINPLQNIHEIIMMQKENTETKAVNKSGSNSKDRSKDAGHYKYMIGERFKFCRYLLVKHLSDGTFGRVFEVEDLMDNRTKKALKMIRAVPRYVEAAETEAQILQKLQVVASASILSSPIPNQIAPSIVKLYETFKHGDNYCMVFEKLGLSLFDLLKKNEYFGFPICAVQSFFQQILQSIGFLHSVQLTHTDLKPENILLQDDDLEAFSSKDEQYKFNFYLPKSNLIKVIDFGGATFADDHHSEIINTRQYRAPEVILGCCKWSEISDVWSIGCIIMELVSGNLLFPTHDNYEHLAMMEKIASPIPKWMAEKCDDEELKLNFTTTDSYFEENRSYYDWPLHCSSQRSRDRVQNLTRIEGILSPNSPRIHPFIHSQSNTNIQITALNLMTDLVHKCLTIDPNLRITCEQALTHPFFSIQLN